MGEGFDVSRFVALHHRLRDGSPTFGENPPVAIRPLRSIRDGDPCNAHRIEMPLHAGTHVDLPRHFSDEQPSLDEIAPREWWLEPAVLVDVPAGEGERIGADALAPHAAAIRGAEFVAVRTGFAARRGEAAFSRNGPSFDPSAARFLLQAAPRLRALGTDAISVSSPARPDEAAAFHRAMLGERRGDRYVFLVEDMNLGAWCAGIAAVWIVPLAVGGADGAPCSIFGVRP